MQMMEFFSLGTNSFYHTLRDVHGVGTDTVFRTVHSVMTGLYQLREEYIHWPEHPERIATKFYDVARMPSVCGCVDGTHVELKPPKEDEDSYINRHQRKSINVMAVCGPDLKVYYVNAQAPGRWHDAKVNAKYNQYECKYTTNT